MWTGIWRIPELHAGGGVCDELASTLKPMLPYFGGGLGAGHRGGPADLPDAAEAAHAAGAVLLTRQLRRRGPPL